MRAQTILSTRRLRLRTWLMSDVKAYTRHCNTPEVMEFLGSVSPRAHVRAEVRWYQRHQAAHGFTFWVVERKSDKAFIGFAGLIRVPEHESPIFQQLEIGWRVRADKWRRGYAFEAASAAAEWAHHHLSEAPVFARIHRGNKASQGLARKLGMRRSRKLERLQDWDDIDLFVFRLRKMVD